VDLDDLLQKTSRTFALAIPMLPEPTRTSVSVAYLLFRIADTFEDATAWPRDRRIDALERLCELVQLPASEQEAAARQLVGWALATPPVEHAGYLELLRQTPELLAALAARPRLVREVIVKHTLRTAEGMAQVVARADERGNLRLASLKDLQGYCYLVAGIVGELLTELFLHDRPSLRDQGPVLRESMVQFGEGLQLVNILKDSGDDAHQGRVYLPPRVTRAELLALTHHDLHAAQRYLHGLQAGEAPRGYVSFCALSLGLAFKAVAALQARGPGTKVPREAVVRFLGALEAALDEGGPLDIAALG
jgi:farnesyl-diphosphate farnesyltransferase